MTSNATFWRVRSVHGSRGSRACSATQCYKRTPRRTPQENRAESKQAGAKTKTKSQETFRFGPRFKVLVGARFLHLAGDFGKGQTLPHDSRCEFAEAVTVVYIVPVVESKRLLVDIAKQVERLDANVGPVRRRLGVF